VGVLARQPDRAPEVVRAGLAATPVPPAGRGRLIGGSHVSDIGVSGVGLEPNGRTDADRPVMS
jgi:hypothetical protein